MFNGLGDQDICEISDLTKKIGRFGAGMPSLVQATAANSVLSAPVSMPMSTSYGLDGVTRQIVPTPAYQMPAGFRVGVFASLCVVGWMAIHISKQGGNNLPVWSLHTR